MTKTNDVMNRRMVSPIATGKPQTAPRSRSFVTVESGSLRLSGPGGWAAANVRKRRRDDLK
jgi:hypothetical protein